MGVKKGPRYDFSMLYRQAQKCITLHFELLGKDNSVIGKGELTPVSASLLIHVLTKVFCSISSVSHSSLVMRNTVV